MNILMSYISISIFLFFNDVADYLQSIIWVGGQSSKCFFGFCHAYDGILSNGMEEYNPKPCIVFQQCILIILTLGTISQLHVCLCLSSSFSILCTSQRITMQFAIFKYMAIKKLMRSYVYQNYHLFKKEN